MSVRELKVSRNPTGNLRSQPTLWHLIRKNTPGRETCFACGESDDRMELHEEWSVADNDDVVLMGLYWLCSFCHGKISEGFRYPKSSLQDLAQRDGIRLPPQHSHENWKVVDDDKGILEIQSREDYHDLLGERFLMGFYDGIKLEEPYFIDFGEDYELTLKRYRVNVREKITSSSAYQAVLENPPESSESGEALQIEHILKGVIPDEGLECYKTGVMYGRHWYYRYYGDNFAFDFHLAYIEGEGERPCWMSNEENYVLHDGVYFARPLLGDQGYSKEQILHFSTVFVRKYGDFPPSTLLGPALRIRWGMANIDLSMAGVPRTTLVVQLLVHSILQNMGGFGEIRESLGLPRTHGQAGPLGHPYRKISNSGICQCGKRHNGILKHRDVCTIMAGIWERRLERDHVESVVSGLNLENYELSSEEWSTP